MKELTNEVTRVGHLTQLACKVRSKEAKNLSIDKEASKVKTNHNIDKKHKTFFQLIGKMWKMLTDLFCPFTEAEENKYRDLKKKLGEVLDLGLSEVERRQILHAMKDLHQGSWFKCSNGHVYAIGECGEALETAQCPECPEIVGGVRRRLVGTSTQALEMDGDVVRQEALWELNDE